MSSIADMIKKQYEKEAGEEPKEKKVVVKKEKKPKSVVETGKMKRVSLWIDKGTYDKIQDIVAILKEDSMAKPYANESELIRNMIRKGVPAVIEDFKRMFPELNF